MNVPRISGTAFAADKKIEKKDLPPAVQKAAEEVSRRGSTPLVVADGGRVLGVVELKDIVKGGIKERFGELRRMGIKTVMITGDNPMTAAAIAAEAHDYLERMQSAAARMRTLIDDLLALFGGRTQPVMAHLIESGKLTLADVKEAEKTLRKLART